jgi:DNA segregation ATPase FtsK/SpoIIIE-like protein
MSTYRSPYLPRENSFVDEVNSGVQLTMPDMSKSVQDIISISMSGQDPMMSYVPDIAYGQDLSDVFPNVDELGVLDDTVNVQQNNNQNTSSGSGNSAVSGDDDEAYNDVVEFAIQTGKISASLIQRRFRFGYNRAARMMDLLEARGIVGPQNGSKPREVLVKLEKNDVEQ